MNRLALTLIALLAAAPALAAPPVNLTDSTGANSQLVDTNGNAHTTGPIQLQDNLGTPVTATPYGALTTSDEPHQVFYDPFDAALDTTNRWTASSAGGGVAPAVSGGNLTLGTGTTANGYSKLSSQASLTPPIPGRLGNSWYLSIPVSPIVNAYSFWGAGSTPGTPTAAAPVTDGYGFELTTAGKLCAVVYAAGVRTCIADLSSSGTAVQPTDGNLHRYIIYYRTDKIYWFLDTINAAGLVASTPASYLQPTVQTLPLLIEAIAGTTNPASSQVTTVAGLAAWDTAKSASQIADGTFPWRKATVSPAGALSTYNIMPGTQITASSGDQSNAAAVATLAGASGKTTYITGFVCGAQGATALLTVQLTVSGILGVTLNYDFRFAAGTTTESNDKNIPFNPPLAASAQNTAIVVTLPAGGTGNTHAYCNATGFQL